MEKDTYELMKVLHGEPSTACPNGIDGDSVDVNDGLGIIHWLLKNDPSVKNFKLVNTAGRKQCVGAVAGKALWTAEEDAKLIELVDASVVGQRLSGHFPGRTHGAVKQHQLVLKQRKLCD